MKHCDEVGSNYQTTRVSITQNPSLITRKADITKNTTLRWLLRDQHIQAASNRW